MGYYRKTLKQWNLGLGLGLNSRGEFSGGDDSTEFTFNVQTDNAGTSTNTQFTLPLNVAETYNFDIDWGDGNTETIITNTPFTHEYGVAGVYTIKIGGANNAFPHMFFNGGGDALKLLFISSWGNILIESLFRSYRGCSNLQLSLTSKPDLSMCDDAFLCFDDCDSITGINWDGVTAPILTNISGFMQGCANLATLNVPDLVGPSVLFMASMAASCPQLTSFNISNWNTINVTDMGNLCLGSTLLDLNISLLNFTSLLSASRMMEGSAFSTTNYNLFLVAADIQVLQNDVPFHAGDACFADGGPATSRGNIIADENWIFTDAGPCDNGNFWIGGISTLWNNDANWSLGHYPTPSEVAIFSGDESNVDCLMNLFATPEGVSIQNGYSGTLTQNGGQVFAIGSASFYQTTGTFAGGDNSFSVDGFIVVVDSGSFTATSGVTSLNVGNLTVTAPAVFAHNGGLIAFKGEAQHIDISGETANAIIVDQTSATSNFTIDNDFTFIGLLEILSGSITGNATVTMDLDASIRSVQGQNTSIPISALIWDIKGAGNNEIYSDKVGGAAQVMGGLRVTKTGGSLTLYDDIAYGVQNVPLLQYISGTVICDPTCKIRDKGFNCDIDWASGPTIPEYIENKRNTLTRATLLSNFNVDKWSYENSGAGGQLNLAGFTVNCLGDMDRGGNMDNPFAGSIIVGGSFSWINGEVDSSAVADWFLTVAGTAWADNVTVEHSDASGGSTVYASNSTDNGNNTNWVFAEGAFTTEDLNAITTPDLNPIFV